ATKFLNCDVWCSNVSPCLGDACPSSPISHETLQEPQIVFHLMESLHLPPYWETRCDSDLTIALISTQHLECWAEYASLYSAMIEQELYGHMDQHKSLKLCKADTAIGISPGALCMSGCAPPGIMIDDADSDVLSVVPDSDADTSS
ncbi:hypothetical protein P692DRAFT_20710104, partial [Suillus brevipes Sb2]